MHADLGFLHHMLPSLLKNYLLQAERTRALQYQNTIHMKDEPFVL